MMSSGMQYLQEINVALIALFAFILWRTVFASAPEPVLPQKKKARKRRFDEALDELLEIQSDWYVKVLLEEELNKIVHRARKDLDQEDSVSGSSDDESDDESEYESEYESDCESDCESEYDSDYGTEDESEYDSEDESEDESEVADQKNDPPQIKLVDEFDKELEDMLKTDSGEQKVLARRRRRR